MDSGYNKISRNKRGGGGGFQWLLVGFMPGVLLGALIGFVLLLSGTITGLQGEPTPIVLTQVVEVFDVVTPENYQAAVITATPEPTDTPIIPTNTPMPTTTASPTATPELPTATPSPTPDFSISGEVIGDFIYLRYGPGTNYPRIGIAYTGERFQITAYHTQFNWLQIRYDTSPTGYAWVLNDLLGNVQGDIFGLPAIAITTFNLPTLTPTPSVVQSGSSITGNTVSLSPQFAALGDELWDIMIEQGFEPGTSYFGSLFLLDLQTGEAISINNDVAYRGTSVNKTSILAALYSVLNDAPNQTLATDIANTMICSNNTSTNRLLSVIGAGDEWQGTALTTEFLRTIGIEDTFLLAPYTADPANPPIPPYAIPVPETNVDQEIGHPEPYNQLTVADEGWLLASMYQCAYQDSGALLSEFPDGTFEPRECRQMLHVMSNNNVDAQLKSGVPANIRVAHKHGWVDGTHANAGVFFTPGGDYVLVMALHSSQVGSDGRRWLSYENAFPSSGPAFAEVSRAVYNYYNPLAPLSAVRDGFIPDAPTCDFSNTPLIGDLIQPVWDN